MKTKFAIGCLVQWYEIKIIKEYIDSLSDALEFYKSNTSDVIVDFTLSLNQDLEKIEGDSIEEIEKEFDELILQLVNKCSLRVKKSQKIISSDTSSKLRNILRKVVSSKDGTASLADKDGYFVGGKTGTAESYGDNKNRIIYFSINNLYFY